MSFPMKDPFLSPKLSFTLYATSLCSYDQLKKVLSICLNDLPNFNSDRMNPIKNS